MPFLNGSDVRTFLERFPEKEVVSTAFALRSLIHTATFSAGYSADPRWEKAIAPSESGKSLLTRMSSRHYPIADLHLALFGLFWFHDPLISFFESDLDLVRQIVETEALNKRLFWPLFQGRLLYDRSFELGFTGIDNLTAKETSRLLAEAPLGVYQVGHLVTGPFGILDSLCMRYFKPKRLLGLWHCPMLDCGELHPVKFVPPRITIIEAYESMSELAIVLWKTKSRWMGPVISWPLAEGDEWQVYSEMPLFLGDCIVGEERTRLLIRILESSDGGRLRDIIRIKRPELPKGRSDELVRNLSTEEQLQLLLLLPDPVICQRIDELVYNGQISVPTTEVREVDPSKRSLCGISRRSSLELSTLGIRTTRHSPVLLLRHLLWNSYAESDELNDLAWRLQAPKGTNIEQALSDFLRVNTPPVAIEKLVLSSPRITRGIADRLNSNINDPGDHARRILEWKLGFDLPRQDSRFAIVDRAIKTFQTALASIATPESNEDRQILRSSGVNAFVEFEGLVDEIVSYIVWILASDHSKISRFLYEKSTASRLVPTVLGKAVSSGGEVVEWKVSGNTLGVGQRYFQELTSWVESLLRADRDSLKRNDKAIHESPSDAITIFPFRHTQLWADANSASLQELAELLREATSIMSKGDVPGTRNGLEHYREPSRFPLMDRIRKTVESMRSFLSFTDEHRLFPKLYWLNGSETDAYGHKSLKLVDHSNSCIQIHMPRTIVGTIMSRGLSQSRPVLVAPGNILGFPNSELLFDIQHESEHSRYWKSYPTRSEAIMLAVPDSDDSTSEDHTESNRRPKIMGNKTTNVADSEINT